MKLSVYQDSGFRLLNKIGEGGLRSYPAAIVNILKGTALVDDTAGYVTNTATDLTYIFHGIAAEPCNNSAGAVGDLSCLVIPPLPNYQFSVPVDGNAVITRALVGIAVDLGADALHVAINDVVRAVWQRLSRVVLNHSRHTNKVFRLHINGHKLNRLAQDR